MGDSVGGPSPRNISHSAFILLGFGPVLSVNIGEKSPDLSSKGQRKDNFEITENSVLSKVSFKNKQKA